LHTGQFKPHAGHTVRTGHALSENRAVIINILTQPTSVF